MPGPPPDPASKRRRRNKPESYGAAEPEVAGEAVSAPESLGFEAHSLISGLWMSLAGSPEAKFYSAADWNRVRLELWFGNGLLIAGEAPGASAWQAFQSGLTALLVSPAEKRRVGIELKNVAEDPDAAAAEAQILEYERHLQSV